MIYLSDVITFVLVFLFVAGGGLTSAFIFGPFGVMLLYVALFFAICGAICMLSIGGPPYLSHWIDRSGFDRVPNYIIILFSLTAPILILGFVYLLARY